MLVAFYRVSTFLVGATEYWLVTQADLGSCNSEMLDLNLKYWSCYENE